ncbi:MAG: radical SAM protein, partial [Candidatus Omnitrophica bacterium]|nr:radical SAM protein [Candidatus Omnitrophota bacterium]
MTKHYTIPFFILHRGCPFKCIFCDQKNITGKISDGPSDVQPRIDEYLSTISADSHIEVGFFGGTFTGLEHDEQLS